MKLDVKCKACQVVLNGYGVPPMMMNLMCSRDLILESKSESQSSHTNPLFRVFAKSAKERAASPR